MVKTDSTTQKPWKLAKSLQSIGLLFDHFSFRPFYIGLLNLKHSKSLKICTRMEMSIIESRVLLGISVF